MNNMAVSAFSKGVSFNGCLLVKSCDSRVAASGSRYLDMSLGDKTGEINTKKWDAATLTFNRGDIVYVQGQVIEYNGKLQFRADQMRPATPDDGASIADFMPVAPYPAEEMLAYINDTIDSISDDDLKRIVRYLIDKQGEKLLYAPAALRLHHAEKGGLLHHTTTMLKAAKALLPVYPDLDASLLYAGIIVHDIQKLTEMDFDTWGQVSDYTVEGQLLGHLVTGVGRVQEAGEAVGARPEAILMLSHMVLSHHYEPEYGSPRKPMFMEAELLHYLDVIDSRLYEMRVAIDAAQPGTFTERIWSLERRLYRREE